jgi:hypothetical protein
MPVIINELEIVTEPTQAPTPAGEGETPQAAAQPAAPPMLSPQDVEAIVRHQAERAARLYAG